MPDSPLVELQEVRYTYPNGVEALRGITLVLPPGELVALMGANGSGKTTLARLMAGLIEPTSGSLTVRGLESLRVSRREWARRVGLVFQNPDHQIFEKTVKAEVAFGPRNVGRSESDVWGSVERTLRTFDLVGLRNRLPAALSGGERKAVAFASTFVLDPKVFLLDEPTKGMDAVRKRELAAIARRRAARGRSVVFITHDVDFAYAFTDRTVVLEEGEVCHDGPTREILTLPNLPEVGLRVPHRVLLEGLLTESESSATETAGTESSPRGEAVGS